MLITAAQYSDFFNSFGFGSASTTLKAVRLAYLEPHKERGNNLFPRCVLIRGMHETSNADWWDARVTFLLTPLSL